MWGILIASCWQRTLKIRSSTMELNILPLDSPALPSTDTEMLIFGTSRSYHWALKPVRAFSVEFIHSALTTCGNYFTPSIQYSKNHPLVIICSTDHHLSRKQHTSRVHCYWTCPIIYKCSMSCSIIHSILADLDSCILSGLCSSV